MAMPTLKEVLNVVDLMVENELEMEKIYRVFMEKFPDSRNFWKLIADDEHNHAEWIAAAKDCLNQGTLPIPAKLIYPYIIQNAIKLVKEQQKVFQSNDKTVAEALKFSNNMENFMLENSFFEIFDCDVPEVKQYHDAIVSETQKHHRMIEENQRKIGNN